MDDLMKCPLCYGDVPRGAVVCRGCKARIEYGTPMWALVFVFLVSTVFGLWAGEALTTWVGWVGGIVFFCLLATGAQHLFRNRAVFKLRY